MLYALFYIAGVLNGALFMRGFYRGWRHPATPSRKD